MILFWSLGIVIFAAGMMLEPQLVKKSFYDSYILIADVLLPSLFPFMIISHLVIATGIKNILSLPIKFLFKLLKLPEKLAPYFLCSAIGGYPTGIKALAAGCECKDIEKREASYYLPFLVNAGPGFVIMAVGKRMFSSYAVGFVFYFSQLAAALIVGKILLKKDACSNMASCNTLTVGDAFIPAVNKAGDAMLGICFFVLFFSLLNSFVSFIFKESSFANMILALNEVTSGCMLLSEEKYGFLGAAFLIGFSGLSCIFQVKAIGEESKIDTSELFLIKLAEGIIALLCTCLSVKLLNITTVVSEIYTPSIETYSPDRLTAALLIGIMFVKVIFYKKGEKR